MFVRFVDVRKGFTNLQLPTIKGKRSNVSNISRELIEEMVPITKMVRVETTYEHTKIGSFVNGNKSLHVST
jgi:hypothetical protein